MKDKRERRRRRRAVGREEMMYRRLMAVVLVAAAAAIGAYLWGKALSTSMLLLGAAAVLLVLEALLLFVNQPARKALHFAVCAACLALLAAGFLSQNYALVNGRPVAKYRLVKQLRVTDAYPANFEKMDGLEALDMRASTVTDFEPIQSLTALRKLDIRKNYAFDRSACEAVSAALPDCEIRWSVPVSNTHYDSGADGFDLRPLNVSVAEIRALMADFPEKNYLYRVPLFGQVYDADVTSLDLRGKAPDAEVIGEALTLLPAVQTVDLRGEKASAKTVAALSDAHPDIRFMFTCDVPGVPMTTEDAEVRVKGRYEDLQAYLAFVAYMPNLTVMNAEDVELTNDQLDQIRAADYGGKLKYSVSAFGLKFSSLTTEVNLDGVPVGRLEDVVDLLSRLPNVKRVSMCNCGLSETQMGWLFDNYPQIKFIWYIEFGHYRLRTDATAFTTALWSGNNYHYNDDTFRALRYCTDLMMLDLGHNRITKLDSFTGLTKLRVLILADNKLTDISDITAFPDLEYVELFLNDITDVTPLTELTHLEDLNLFFNPLRENHKVLRKMTWLKRLWIGGCRLTTQDIIDLQQALPKTTVNVKGTGSTGNGWRSHPHYDTLVRMYKEERYIPFD